MLDRPIAFIYSTRGDDEVCHRLLAEYNHKLGRQFVVVFNACNPDFVENTIERFPLICPIDWDGNPEFFTHSVNRGLRYARHKDWDAYVMTEEAKMPVPEYALSSQGMLFSLEALKEVGVLSPNLILSHYCMDYALRCKVKELPLTISPELLNKELQAENYWDILKFASSWSIPDDVSPKEFWEYASSKEYVWSPEMYIE